MTVTPVTEGTATVTVTATDVGGSNTAATQSVHSDGGRREPAAFHRPRDSRRGVTPVRAVHFTELRTRIDGVRASVGLGPYAWTDPVLTAGSTRVRLVHLLEMRWALAPVFAAKGQRPPFWTDAAPAAGVKPRSGPRTCWSCAPRSVGAGMTRARGDLALRPALHFRGTCRQYERLGRRGRIASRGLSTICSPPRPAAARCGTTP